MHPYIKEVIYNNNNNSSQLDFTSVTDMNQPNDWIIYKSLNDEDEKYKYIYSLCINYMSVKCGGCVYGLSNYVIVSQDDNIQLDVSDDKTYCTVITNKYTYKFIQSNNSDILNNNGCKYNTKYIELVSIEKNNKEIENFDKYYLELDHNVLNLYMNDKYVWSKIISLHYTEGIYFVVEDKICTVIDNGGGILDVFNTDGTLYKQIQTSMDYIENAKIIYKNDIAKYLRLEGFVWQPVFVKEYIDIKSLFTDKLKQKTISEYDDAYNNSDIETDDFSEDK